MAGLQAAELVGAALQETGRTLTRLPGRSATRGLHEVREFGPALRSALVRNGMASDLVALNYAAALENWNRPTSQVDVAVIGLGGSVELAAELKAWDLGHQLFDLAKVCCLLAAGVRGGFLICAVQRACDFDRLAGGELFPASEGEVRHHDFIDLIAKHREEWHRHVGKGRPEPTSVPARVSTTALSSSVAFDAYPGHSARAVQVLVSNPSPVSLTDGWPDRIDAPR